MLIIAEKHTHVRSSPGVLGDALTLCTALLPVSAPHVRDDSFPRAGLKNLQLMLSLRLPHRFITPARVKTYLWCHELRFHHFTVLTECFYASCLLYFLSDCAHNFSSLCMKHVLVFHFVFESKFFCYQPRHESFWFGVWASNRERTKTSLWTDEGLSVRRAANTSLAICERTATEGIRRRRDGSLAELTHISDDFGPFQEHQTALL